MASQCEQCSYYTYDEEYDEYDEYYDETEDGIDNPTWKLVNMQSVAENK